MKILTLLITLFIVMPMWSQPYQVEQLQSTIQSKLMVQVEDPQQSAHADWLITHPEIEAAIYRTGDKELVLSNGLISRRIRVSPNAATISLKNLVTREEYIRSVKPEAMVTIDGISYPVGGLSGQKEHGYFLHEWLEDMHATENSFLLQDFEIRELTPEVQWKQVRWNPSTQWERKGKEVVFYYAHEDPNLEGIRVQVHYEIYNNLPLIGKMISIDNQGNHDIRINHFTSEIIAHPEKNNFVDQPARWDLPNLYLENDYAFGGFTYIESPNAISWESDPEYTSQVNWEMKTPAILKSQPTHGPDYTLVKGERFESFRTYLLALDGTDRERNGLSIRKMYRTLAPWVTENPIFMHLTTTNPNKVKAAIDQCEETGYEMVILSFGSGLNMEELSGKNIRNFKELADYAHTKGIQLGGYSLFSSRRINDETDVIDIATGKPGGAKFGNAPCGGSEWGIAYFRKLEQFLENTGFDVLEHDGPYPGDFCASTKHPGHEGYGDSQWKQWRQTTDFYKYLRSRGIYTNIPDIYHLAGSNKIGIGYREVNWSLPRDQQIMLGRQNIYDGTWLRTPSMAWTFVPLTQYHGGGTEATLEPLAEHLREYDAHMTQNYGSGVQACYRGPRLYDTDATKELVIHKISHYKKYREILNADIIHLRRPDGRDWDGILHVDPQQEINGYAMIYNPTNEAITRKITLPLYYAGLEENAKISLNEGPPAEYRLNRNYEVEVEVTIPSNGTISVIISRDPDAIF
ncbi:MAG: alpha-galactosidase [Bacteroidota bacterium]